MFVISAIILWSNAFLLYFVVPSVQYSLYTPLLHKSTFHLYIPNSLKKPNKEIQLLNLLYVFVCPELKNYIFTQQTLMEK